MTSDEVIKLINQYGIGYGLLFGAIFLIISFLINVVFTERVKNSHLIKLASLQSQLTVLTNENNIRFTKTFDTQSIVMATLYKKLIELRNASNILSYSIGDNNSEEYMSARDTYNNSVKDFTDYFQPNEIYIPEETAKTIHYFINSTDKWLARQGHMIRLIDATSPSNDKRDKAISLLGNEIDFFIKTLNDIKEDIYKDFQKHLGVRK